VGRLGTSATAFAMAAQAVILGGHAARRPREDNLYLARGVLAPSNAALVERAVTIVEALGRQRRHSGRGTRASVTSSAR
jgi:uncharacterized protein (DUF849 family)